ncbi:MAG: hypothetical protein ABL921_27090 [Pirellula sp.]
MDRDTLLDAIRKGPIRVHMNDGQHFDILNLEMAVVDDIAAHVLTRNDDGKYRTKILSLVCMVSIESISQNA